MKRSQLIQLIHQRQSFLCVGLDTDPNKIPAGIGMLEFNKAIIDATRPYCVAYKPNLAFYERMGSLGWDLLQKTLAYIGNEHFTIADAKRGDIGNTSLYYAKTFFETYVFDSVTVAPYMGEDSVKPFLTTEGKWAIVLALTSNAGAADFEMLPLQSGVPLWQEVINKSKRWGNNENMMYVVGATRPELLAEVRSLVPDHFLLVPGVGAQGGSLSKVCKFGLNDDVGLLINASRSILYADASPAGFAKAAEAEAKALQLEMATILQSQ